MTVPSPLKGTAVPTPMTLTRPHLPALGGTALRTSLLVGASVFMAGLHAATVSASVQGSTGRPLNDAVLLLEPLPGKVPVKPLTGVEIGQENKTFVPALTVVTVGTKVLFPNRDAVRHHVYSFSDAKKFELKLYTGKPENPVQFDRAGVVVLGCNIHDQMVGWVIVSDTPWYARSSSGRAVIADVPAGSYRLRGWHPDLPPGSPGVELAVTVGATDMTVAVKLPVAGT